MGRYYDWLNPPLHPYDNRPRHRIDYERVEIPGDALHDRTLNDCWCGDPDKRLACRKKLWRRWRTGYYDRHEPCKPTRWDSKGNKIPEPDGPREQCGARCRDGHACKSLAVRNRYTGRLSNRCRMHGGFSTGPRTEAGKAAALAALVMGRNRSL